MTVKNLGNISEVFDETGSFYCRTSQIDKVYNFMSDGVKAVSVCSNGTCEKKYIFNPEIAPYMWDDDGNIIFPYEIK